MSKSWPVVPLGEVLTHRKEFIQIDDAAMYKRCRVKLHAQGIVLRDEVPGAEIKTKKQQVCKAGEFLVAEIDAKVGGFGIVPDTMEGSIVSSHYFLFQIDKSRLKRKYLDYFIRTPYFRDQVTAQGSTNYAAIRPKDVLGYQIPLPPLSEQQRIVARIEELAVKIEEARGLRQKAVEEAEVILASSMTSVFNFSDVQSRLGAFVTVMGGFAFESSRYDENGNYQVLRIGNVKDGFLDLSRAPVKWMFDEKNNNQLKKYKLLAGDVVISMTGTRNKRDYGFAAMVPKNAQLLLNQRVGKIIPKVDIYPSYLLCFLRSPFFRDGLFPKATGTANQANIGNKDIENVFFALPPLHEQRRIVAYLDNLQAKLDSLKRLQAGTAAELAAMLPSVLDRAFKGEL